MNFFAMRYVGDLQQRQRLNETITHSLVEVLAPQAINVMLLVLYFILMLSYNCRTPLCRPAPEYGQEYTAEHG